MKKHFEPISTLAEKVTDVHEGIYRSQSFWLCVVCYYPDYLQIDKK